MIPYRGIVAALGIATHDNVPKVVIISQGDSGKEPRDIHQEVPWEASNFFSRDVIEKAKLKLIPFDQSRLRREIKGTARQVLNRDLELYELRKFFATWMISQGVSESIVNTLQGRAPPRIAKVRKPLKSDYLNAAHVSHRSPIIFNVSITPTARKTIPIARYTFFSDALLANLERK